MRLAPDRSDLTSRMTAPGLVATLRRRLPLVIGAGVVLAVAALAVVYFMFFSGDSPPPLTLSTQPTVTAGAPSTAAPASPTTAAGGATPSTAPGTPTTAATSTGTSALAGRWTIGSGSTAGYRVREKLARLPAQSDAVGRTSAITGSIQIARQGSQLVVAEGAKFDVDVSKLSSDESQRDNRIRTEGLQSNRFPMATFVSTGAIDFPTSAESGAAVKTNATGDLTIHGVTKRVTIPLDAQVAGGRIEVVGSLKFPFSDFGMSPPNVAGFVTVDSEATLEFKLIFDKQ